MDPLSVINTAVTSVTTAIEFAKLLRDAGLSLKNAESKLKFAQMIEALSDAKIQMADVKQLLIEKEETITKLRESLESQSKLVPRNSAYWLLDEKGNIVRGPYCTRCFEADHVSRTLVPGERWPKVMCPACKNLLDSPPVYEYLRPDVIETAKQVQQQIDREEREMRRLTDCYQVAAQAST